MFSIFSTAYRIDSSLILLAVSRHVPYSFWKPRKSKYNSLCAEIWGSVLVWIYWEKPMSNKWLVTTGNAPIRTWEFYLLSAVVSQVVSSTVLQSWLNPHAESCKLEFSCHLPFVHVDPLRPLVLLHPTAGWLFESPLFLFTHVSHALLHISQWPTLYVTGMSCWAEAVEALARGSAKPRQC